MDETDVNRERHVLGLATLERHVSVEGGVSCCITAGCTVPLAMGREGMVAPLVLDVFCLVVIPSVVPWVGWYESGSGWPLALWNVLDLSGDTPIPALSAVAVSVVHTLSVVVCCVLVGTPEAAAVAGNGLEFHGSVIGLLQGSADG